MFSSNVINTIALLIINNKLYIKSIFINFAKNLIK